MLIPPKYFHTPEIDRLIQSITALKHQLDQTPISPTRLDAQIQKNILRSSLYSARIEGNQLIEADVDLQTAMSSDQLHHQEIANLYTAMHLIRNNAWQDMVSIADLKKLHSIVMRGISSDAGQFRTEQSAIFNQAGVAIYITPSPLELPNLLDRLFAYCHESTQHSLVKSTITHFIFEKIHPFLDGNGRVGRLLIHLLLKKDGFDLQGRVPFETYIDANKELYYAGLASSQKDITIYVEYILTAIHQALSNVVANQISPEQTIEDTLPSRRLEILRIIRDHRSVSFDFIKRRFMAVPDRTIGYDLKQLQKAGLIYKRGSTRGVVYEPK